MAISIPMIVTFTAYGKIAYTLYRSKQRVAAHGNGEGRKAKAAGGRGTVAKKLSLQVRTMFIVSSLFTLLWCPYAIVCLMEHALVIPPVYLRAVGWLGMGNSCANSVALAISNTSYRKAFKRILCCRLREKAGNVTQITVSYMHS